MVHRYRWAPYTAGSALDGLPDVFVTRAFPIDAL